MSDNTSLAILYVYEGKFGLPSIDPKCLQLLFYLRLHPGHNIKIKTPDKWATPLLPALKYKSRLLIQFEEILEILMKLVEPTCDEEFDDETKKRIREYRSMNLQMLENPFILNFWGYKRNIDYFSNLYSSAIHPRLRESFKKSVRIYHMEHVLIILNDHIFSECVEYGNRAVDRYLHFINVLLGSKKFLFGDSPSTCDVYLCGYLAPLMTYNFPNKQLKKLLMKYTKIVKYVDNYVEIYGDRRHDATDIDDFVEETPRSNRKIWYIIICIFTAFLGCGVYKYRGG